jgi:hypothetical protein
VVSLSFLNNAKAIFETARNVTIVFCNNGCLPQSVISHLESEGFATLRALFFIGAVRQESSMGTCVSWTGGNRAVWNEIVSANPSPVVESQEVLQQLSFLLNSGERFVDWLRTDNIFAMERCKFFTNFILAAGIGRRKEKNKRLYSRLNSGTLDMTASQCARLWQSHGVNENDLKSVLLKTVAATEENFNSLSLAAVHGDDSTMRWFLSFLASEISNVADVADFVQLLKFIENVRDEWGI